MKLRLYGMMLAASALVALGACSSEETGEGSGGAGNEGGGTGATGNEGGNGLTGNEGGSGNEGGGTGGTADCLSCAIEIQCQQELRTGPICDSEFCEGSGELFDALAACICEECAVECEMTCAMMEETNPDCGTCQTTAATGACSAEFGECSNDL